MKPLRVESSTVLPRVFFGMRAALKDLPPLILASASPRRAELLRQLSLDFKVVPADVAEIHHEQMTARELSQVNAYRKARAVAKKFPDALVLGADTLVYLEYAAVRQAGHARGGLSDAGAVAGPHAPRDHRHLPAAPARASPGGLRRNAPPSRFIPWTR